MRYHKSYLNNLLFLSNPSNLIIDKNLLAFDFNDRIVILAWTQDLESFLQNYIDIRIN